MTFASYKRKILEDPRSGNLNFSLDGQIYYVYRVTHIASKTHYYGSKNDKCDISIGVTYFTSSTDINFKNDFKTNSGNYKVKIIRRFNNSADKIIFESYIHDYFKVSTQSNFINRMNQTPFGVNATGFKHSINTRENMARLAVKREEEIRRDSLRYQERSEKQSKSAIRAHLQIKDDPQRFDEMVKNHSLGAIKFQAELAADPERVALRQINMSSASTKTQLEIKSDPERSKARSKKLSDASIKAHTELKNNPKKKLAIQKKKSKPVSQYDLKGNFIKTFFGQSEAARQMGYTNSSGICACVNGRESQYKGYIWKEL